MLLSSVSLVGADMTCYSLPLFYTLSSHKIGGMSVRVGRQLILLQKETVLSYQI